MRVERRNRRILGLVGTGALVGSAAVAVVLAGRPDSSKRNLASGSGSSERAVAASPLSSLSEQARALPAAPESGFAIPEPVQLVATGGESRWAAVAATVSARTAPNAGARAITSVSTRTPEGTTNVVLVLARRRDAAGRLWIRVRLPVLPNNTTGWVPRSALGGYGVVHTRLVIDVERFTATLFRDGKRIFRAPVGVGKPAWPTPRGQFYIRDKLTSFSSPFYGPLAFGTSARSSVLTDWPGGGFIGIHGTNAPGLIPGRISHGCVRLRNSDILELGRLMPVGTPLAIT